MAAAPGRMEDGTLSDTSLRLLERRNAQGILDRARQDRIVLGLWRSGAFPAQREQRPPVLHAMDCARLSGSVSTLRALGDGAILWRAFLAISRTLRHVPELSNLERQKEAIRIILDIEQHLIENYVQWGRIP